MIIKRLTMHNFGVYAGTNTFDFSNNKPIVLIGGMNGRGKTTFLEAILLSLYGSNSVSFIESKYRSYSQYLRSFVNKSSEEKDCYIELDFVMTENSSERYLVRREWNSKSRITKEKITVYKNAEESEFLTNNWAMFIESILPVELSRFYFFDGEKIAELALDDTNAQMKESIRAMLGITVLDVLKNDLEKSLKNNSKKIRSNEIVTSLDILKSEKDELQYELDECDEKIESITIKITEKEDKLEKLRKKYEIKGGSVLEQKNELLKRRSDIQGEISKNNESLVNIASTDLPLIMVQDLIRDIKLQAEDEHNDFIMKQAIEQIDDFLLAFLSQNQDKGNESTEFVDFIKENISNSSTEQIYNLSEHALFQLNSLLEKILESRKEEAKKCLRDKVELQKKLDEIDSYLSVDLNETELNSVYKSIKKFENNLIDIKANLLQEEEKRKIVNNEFLVKSSEYSDAVEKYLSNVEVIDENERLVKYTGMALKMVEAYTVQLQTRKTDVLAYNITSCYKKLANKRNLIDRIIMNPRTLDIKYLDANNNEVHNESLSAGEKQLMVIAILWALANCSKKKLPVIIDTPLSRLDSMHRTAMVTTYFPNASEQTIILSTDSEIDHNYYDLMKDSVGDEFTLVYDEDTRSTSIKKGYFN